MESNKHKLLTGILNLSSVVSSTLGPKGRNVLIRDPEDVGPIITKDGVTVAKAIKFKDKYENLGAELVIEAANKAVTEAGDATTTCTLLAAEIIKEAIKYSDSTHPIDIARQLTSIQTVLEDLIKTSAEKITKKEELIQVATISANNDQYIGRLIGEAFDTVGVNGLVKIEPSFKKETTLHITEGMHFRTGYVHPSFNNKKDFVKFKDALILITDKNIGSILDVKEYIIYAQNLDRPIVIFCDEASTQTLAAAFNLRSEGTQIAFCKLPSYGEERIEILDDIALVSNGYFIKEEADTLLTDYSPENSLGSVNEIIIKEDHTIIFSDSYHPEDLEERITAIKEDIKSSTNTYDKSRFEKRLASLAGGIATIKIGAQTEIEALEKVHRTEDAVLSTKSAQIHGTVVGGGFLLYYIADFLKSYILEYPDNTGAKILERALRSPAKKILENAGLHADTILKDIDYDKNYLFNAHTLSYGDLRKEGVLDSAFVLQTALKTAVSTAKTVLLTENILIQ